MGRRYVPNGELSRCTCQSNVSKAFILQIELTFSESLLRSASIHNYTIDELEGARRGSLREAAVKLRRDKSIDSILPYIIRVCTVLRPSITARLWDAGGIDWLGITLIYVMSMRPSGGFYPVPCP